MFSAFVPTEFTAAASKARLIEILEGKDGAAIPTAHVLKTSKDVRVKLYRCCGTIELYTVKCMSDHAALRLASFNLPRGFPIVVVDGVPTFGGFYPKFRNDEKEKPITDPVEIILNKKMSGYLAMIVAFATPDGPKWTVACKNSTDNKFARAAARIVEPLMTEDVVLQLIERNLCVCGEVMAFFDQTHGASVRREAFVVTCLSAPPVEVGKIRSFLPLEEVVEWCMENRFETGAYYRVRGEKCTELLEALKLRRDEMTDSLLKEVLSRLEGDGAIEIVGDENIHEQVLGDTLEGLVMRVTTSRGSTETVKYKFINYTIRTMFVRPAFQAGRRLRDSDFDSFARHWCRGVNVRQSLKYWRQVYDDLVAAEEGFQPQYPVPPQGDDDPFYIAPHVEFCHRFIDGTKRAPISECGEEHEEEVTKLPITVVVGSIGSGKTTLAEKIAKETGVEHVDGDSFAGLSPDIVLQLGAERNAFTYSEIIRCALDKGVVVSCGGGQLLSLQGVDICEYTRLITRRRVELDVTLVIISSSVMDLVRVEEMTPEIVDEVKKTYFMDDYTDAIVRARGWTAPKKGGSFIEKCHKNAELLDQLIPLASTVWLAPHATAGKSVDTTPLTVPRSVGGHFCFGQHRLTACVVGQVKHITLAYDPEGVPYEWVLKSSLRVVGSRFTATEMCDKPRKMVTFVKIDDPEVRQLRTDGIPTHVTLYTGGGARPVISGKVCAAIESGMDVYTDEIGTSYRITYVDDVKVAIVGEFFC